MEDAYTVRTESGLIRLMSEEDVGKLVRNSIQRAKSSSAKATSFTRSRSRRSASPRAEFVAAASKIKPPSVLTPRRARDPQVPRETTGAGTETPDDKKLETTGFVREASRRAGSRNRQLIKKENRADSASRDIVASGERDNIPSLQDTQMTEGINHEASADISTKSIQREVAEKLANNNAEISVDPVATKPLQKRFPTWLSYLSESEVKESDSKRSFTVNTEAEGRKNLSESEINNLVRSSIQRARQLAKSKAKRHISPSPTGYTKAKERKEKRDPIASSSRKMSAPSPLGTIHRKFTWSSIEESSSDEDKKMVLKKKNKQKSKDEDTEKSKQMNSEADDIVPKEAQPTEEGANDRDKAMDRGEVAPPFSATVFDDELTTVSEAYGRLLARPGLESSELRDVDMTTKTDDYHQMNHIDPPGLHQVTEQKFAANPPQATIENQVDNVSPHSHLVPKEPESESKGEFHEEIQEKQLDIESAQAIVQNVTLDTVVRDSSPDVQLQHRTNSFDSSGLFTDATNNTLMDDSGFKPADAAGELTETSVPAMIGDVRQDNGNAVTEPEKEEGDVFSVHDTSSNPTTPAVDDIALNALSECTEVTVNESIDSSKPLNDSAKEVMNTLLKELLFLKTPESKKSHEVSFGGSTEFSLKTKSDIISDESPNIIDQTAMRSEAMASPFSETTSQKSRSSLLGASNSDLKESLTQGGEISLPSVSDKLTPIESPDNSTEECDPQVHEIDSQSVATAEQKHKADCIESDQWSSSKIECLNESQLESTLDWSEMPMASKVQVRTTLENCSDSLENPDHSPGEKNIVTATVVRSDLTIDSDVVAARISSRKRPSNLTDFLDPTASGTEGQRTPKREANAGNESDLVSAAAPVVFPIFQQPQQRIDWAPYVNNDVAAVSHVTTQVSVQKPPFPTQPLYQQSQIERTPKHEASNVTKGSDLASESAKLLTTAPVCFPTFQQPRNDRASSATDSSAATQLTTHVDPTPPFSTQTAYQQSQTECTPKHEANNFAKGSDLATESAKQLTAAPIIFPTFQQPQQRINRATYATGDSPAATYLATQVLIQKPPFLNQTSHQESQTDRVWKNESPVSFRDEPFLEPKQSVSSSDEYPTTSLKYKFSNSVKSDKISTSVKSESKTTESTRRKSRAKRDRKFTKHRKNSESEEVVITDELIAEIASKKGAKVTTEELNEIMKASSPSKVRKQTEEISNIDTQIDDDHLVSLVSEDAETMSRPPSDKRGKQGKASPHKTPGFAPSYIRSKFCMDFLDLFRQLVQDADEDTVDEETLNSAGVTWTESQGEVGTLEGTVHYDTDAGFDEKQSRITFSFSDAEQLSTDDNSEAYSSTEESYTKKSWPVWRK